MHIVFEKKTVLVCLEKLNENTIKLMTLGRTKLKLVENSVT
jgi:hypothetical protein